MTETKLNIGIDLERQILAFCLDDRNFFISIHGILLPEHFQNETWSKVWKFIIGYFDKYLSTPTLTIIVHTFGQAGLESEINSLREDLIVNEPTNKEYLQHKVIKIIRDQEFKKFVLAAAAETEQADPDYEKFEKDIKRILTMQVDLNLGTNYFCAAERIAKVISLEADKISTGFPTIDQVLEGGLMKKELTAFLGTPGMGKSLFLVNIGKNMIRLGKKVVHYTMEMSEERCGIRYDCALYNSTSREILTNYEDIVKKIGEERILLKDNLWIKEYPTGVATVNHLRAHLTKLKEYKDFIPDVILVDYGDIMRPKRRSTKETNSYEEQGSIFEELRALATEQNVPIVTATQTNRSAMDKEVITMKEIGDSFKKARTLDTLFAIISRPEDQMSNPQVLRIYVAKNRNSIAGIFIGFEVDKAKMQLKDCGILTK